MKKKSERVNYTYWQREKGGKGGGGGKRVLGGERKRKKRRRRVPRRTVLSSISWINWLARRSWPEPFRTGRCAGPCPSSSLRRSAGKKKEEEETRIQSTWPLAFIPSSFRLLFAFWDGEMGRWLRRMRSLTGLQSTMTSPSRNDTSSVSSAS